MMEYLRKPLYRIWVEGRPLSFQSDPKHRSKYLDKITEAAKSVVTSPIKSNRIDIEICFQSVKSLRPDVDNILKPILDALKGIVYEDDSQVCSIKVIALPADEAYEIDGPLDSEFIKKLMGSHGKVFLIEIFVGSVIHK